MFDAIASEQARKERSYVCVCVGWGKGEGGGGGGAVTPVQGLANVCDMTHACSTAASFWSKTLVYTDGLLEYKSLYSNTCCIQILNKSLYSDTRCIQMSYSSTCCIQVHVVYEHAVFRYKSVPCISLLLCVFGRMCVRACVYACAHIKRSTNMQICVCKTNAAATQKKNGESVPRERTLR